LRIFVVDAEQRRAINSLPTSRPHFGLPFPTKNKLNNPSAGTIRKLRSTFPTVTITEPG